MDPLLFFLSLTGIILQLFLCCFFLFFSLLFCSLSISPWGCGVAPYRWDTWLSLTQAVDCWDKDPSLQLTHLYHTSSNLFICLYNLGVSLFLSLTLSTNITVLLLCLPLTSLHVCSYSSWSQRSHNPPSLIFILFLSCANHFRTPFFPLWSLLYKHINVNDVLLINCKDMNEKKWYSDISFLPAFLVPSTVITLLFQWGPMDHLERPILTWSYTRNYHNQKSARRFIFLFDLLQFLFVFIAFSVAPWLGFTQGENIKYIHVKNIKRILRFITGLLSAIFCMIFIF